MPRAEAIDLVAPRGSSRRSLPRSLEATGNKTAKVEQGGLPWIFEGREDGWIC
jgi:hypothetical protein